jgi:anti-sigma28 factor (negative regulator of flagellin synthesis)
MTSNEAGSAQPERDESEVGADGEGDSRVRELKTKILTGRYDVPALEVADAIIAAHRCVWPEEG